MANVPNPIAIPKLSKDNFDEWQVHIESYARTLGVSAALKDNYDLSNVDDAKDKAAFWSLSNVMIVSITQELSHLMKQLGQPDERFHPWNILEHLRREIRPHATAQRHALKHEFFRLQLENGESLSKFISRIDKTVSRANEAINAALQAKGAQQPKCQPWLLTK